MDITHSTEQNNIPSKADQAKIDDALKHLTTEQKKLYVTAVGEGYKDEVCEQCGIVLLAFHHFIRCDVEKCPMKSKGSDGTSKSVLEMLLGEKKSESLQ